MDRLCRKSEDDHEPGEVLEKHETEIHNTSEYCKAFYNFFCHDSVLFGQFSKIIKTGRD